MPTIANQKRKLRADIHRRVYEAYDAGNEPFRFGMVRQLVPLYSKTLTLAELEKWWSFLEALKEADNE